MAKRKAIKTQNHMTKNAEWKWILAPILIVLIGSVILFTQYLGNKKSSYENIDYIRSFMTSTGKLNDFSNKLNMDDPKTDIKWYWDENKNVRIEFGRIVMDFEWEEFILESTQEKLGTIGFAFESETVDGRKDLVCYWRGEVVERWVR